MVLWKRFDFLKLGIWCLKFGTWNSRPELLKIETLKTLDFERFETWNFEKLKLEVFEFVIWNFEHEIWGLKFLQLEILGILNLKIGLGI